MGLVEVFNGFCLDLYNAKQHPDVKTGKKTEDDVLMEFLETFEQHHSLMVRTIGGFRRLMWVE